MAIGLGGLALSGVVLFGAIKMMRLESYPAAVVASVLAMVVTPGNLVGLPIGIWAFVTLISRDVRTAFTLQAGRRSRNETRAAVADSDKERTSPRPRMVPVFATLNVVVALMLMFILAAPDPEPFTDGENPWRVYEQVTAVLGFIMATGLFAAAIGLYLWRPWGRKLTIGVMIYALVSLVIDIPYMARYVIPDLYTEIQLEWMAEGMPPAAAEVSAMHLLALIFIPVIVTGLIWNVGQIVYMMRPRVIAAFELHVAKAPSQ